MHALSITVSGKDIVELQQNITQLLKVISFSTSTVENDEKRTEDSEIVQIEKKQKRAHKTNTKKSKNEGDAAANAEANIDEVNTDEATSPIDISKLKEETQDATPQPALNFADVRNALKELCDVGERGTKAGHEILTSFNVQRISQLKEDDYAVFVSKVKEALGKL